MDMIRHEQNDDVKNVVSFSMFSKLVIFVSSVQEKNLNPNDPVSEFSFTYVTLKWFWKYILEIAIFPSPLGGLVMPTCLT